MAKPKGKPDLYKRARGYGTLNQLHKIQHIEITLDWRPVPGFPEYEVNQLRQVRRVSTKAYQQPYQFAMRPGEGEFVEFWVDRRKHVMSLDSIMEATFKKTGF